MQARNTVRVSQFFSVQFLSMLVGLFMYLSNVSTRIGTSDSMLQPIVFAILNACTVFPLLWYCSRRKEGILIEADSISRFLSVIIAAVFTIIYFISAVRTTARFDLFASSEMFPETDMTFFIIGIVIVCALLSLMGFGALCRGAVVFLILVVAATLFIFFTVLSKIDMINYTPLLTDGFGNFIKSGVSFSVFPIEIGAVVLFRSELKGNIKKGYYSWLLGTAALLFIISFAVVGTLSSFADTQLFPTFAIATLGEIGLMERLDSLETAIWILCVVSKLTFLFIIVTKSASHIFKNLNPAYITAAAALLLCIIMVVITGNIENFSFLSNTWGLAVSYLLLFFAVPLVFFVASSVNRRKAVLKKV